MHDNCGLWCKYSPKHPEGSRKQQTDDEKRKYYDMSIENDKNMYEQVKELTSRYFTIDMLKQCYHAFHSNFNKAFKKLVT